MGLIGFILEFLSLSKECLFLAWEQPKFLDAIHHWFPHEIKSEERREIPPYWWHVTTKIWVVLLIGRATGEICFNQSEAATQTCIVIFHPYGISVVVQRSFARDLVITSRNIGCFKLRKKRELCSSLKVSWNDRINSE